MQLAPCSGHGEIDFTSSDLIIVFVYSVHPFSKTCSNEARSLPFRKDLHQQIDAYFIQYSLIWYTTKEVDNSI